MLLRYRRKPALLAFVPDIRRELPVAPDLFPYHNKFAGNFLRVSVLRFEAEGSDLARHGEFPAGLRILFYRQT